MSKVQPIARDKSLVVHKASKILQSKAGCGHVDKSLVKKAEEAVHDIDYKPFAQERIARLGTLIEEAGSGGDYRLFLEEAKKIVVNLKSTASTFGYDIISDLTHIMLEFLEVTQEFDRDVIDLVDGHQKTLLYLVQQGVQDASSEEAQTLKQELCEACMRYREKRSDD